MTTARWWIPVLVAALAQPTTASAQSGDDWAVLSARMTADLTAGDGGALVTMTYEFGAAASDDPLPVERSIPLELLGFGDATAADFLRDGSERVVLWPTVGSHRAATLRPPFGTVGDVLTVELSYRIDAAAETVGDRVLGRVPILTGPPPRTGGTTGGFEATLLLPEGWEPHELFPTGMRLQPDGSYAVSLPVVPALLSFRSAPGGGWTPGLPLVLDVLTLLVLVTFAGFGWQHMRSITA